MGIDLIYRHRDPAVGSPHGKYTGADG